MLNIDDFSKKLNQIFEYYNLNASSFADKIGVQRSSLSHLLSGRNKPSLDFILRIVDIFPEVDLYWILKNEGAFPKDNTPPTPTIIQKEIFEEDVLPSEDLFSTIDHKVIETTPTPSITETSLPISKEIKISGEIDQIIIFYKDGTFSHYRPK